jgi:hypothetical protein
LGDDSFPEEAPVKSSEAQWEGWEAALPSTQVRKRPPLPKHLVPLLLELCKFLKISSSMAISPFFWVVLILNTVSSLLVFCIALMLSAEWLEDSK